MFLILQLETDGGDQWDIGDADDNTKKFFGKIWWSIFLSLNVNELLEKLNTHEETQVLFVLRLNIPVNNSSVMSWVLPVFSGSKVSCSRTQHVGGRF